MRGRIAVESHRETWEQLLAQAIRYCATESEEYADPADADKGPAQYGKTIGHSFGRRLTNWMETLGFAYLMTGEARFGEHGARLLVAAAQVLPVTEARMAQSYAGGRGDFMRGLALGLDFFEELLTDFDRRTVQSVSAGYIRDILNEAREEGMWWVPYHNYVGVAIGAAGCLGLKLRDAYPDDSAGWLDESVGLIRRWLDNAFDERGSNCEGTGYAVYALSNAVLFMHALERNGGPNLFEHPHLRRVPHFYAMSLLPGEMVFDARNDASYDGFWDPFMLRLAQAYDNGLAKWLFERCGTDRSFLRIAWDNPVKPLGPEGAKAPLAEHFTGRGLCIFRTGWEEGDLMFSIEAGPFYRKTHNQADKGHFTLYGLGRRWAVDSGYGNNQNPEGRAQTVAHSCVLIDGKGQALSGAGLGTSGRILNYEYVETHGYALADCAEAYNRNSDGHPGVGVRHALRHAYFVPPAAETAGYAVLLDDIRKDDEPHAYTWLLQIDSGMTVNIEGPRTVIAPKPGPSGPESNSRLIVQVRADSAPLMEVDQYEERPRLKVKSRSRNPDFVSLLMLLPAGTAEPEVVFTDRADSIEMEVKWPDRRDRLSWPRHGERIPQLVFSK